MRFDIKRPCEHCPFRRNVHPFLDRAPQIAEAMRDDYTWFACHETTGVTNGKEIRAEDQSHCIGAAIVLWRSNMMNVPIRLALEVGLLEQSVLDQPALVFDSLEEFVQHHNEKTVFSSSIKAREEIVKGE